MQETLGSLTRRATNGTYLSTKRFIRWRSRISMCAALSFPIIVAACAETPAAVLEVDTVEVKGRDTIPMYVTTALESGDWQMGIAGEVLSKPLAIRIRSSGKPVANVRVHWWADEGELPMWSLSDSTGVARATWTLGTKAGSQSARGFLTTQAGHELLPVKFTANAIHGAATTVVAEPRVLQSIPANQCGSFWWLRAAAADRNGNRVFTPVIRWTASSALSVVRGTTDDIAAPDNDGWTVLAVHPNGIVGQAVVRATIPGGTFVEFTLDISPKVYEVTLADGSYYNDEGLQFSSRQNCDPNNLFAAVDTIPAGETVTWINRRWSGGSMQIVSFGDDVFAGSPPIPRDGTYQVNFTTPGTYRYREASDTSVVGVIVVVQKTQN